MASEPERGLARGNDPEAVRARRLLRLIVAGGLALRLLSAHTFPLLDDETYYWLWSRLPAASYLDQPPFIAYLIRLTTAFSDEPFWLRAGPLLIGVLTTLALFILGREMFDSRAGLVAAAVYQIVPVLAGGGFLATPDSPLFLWWTLAMLCGWRAVTGDARWWLAAGAAVGLGMLSKLPMSLLALGLLGFAATRRREALRAPWPYAGTVVALLLFAPVLWWNVANDWATIRFILTQRPGGTPTGFAGLLAITIEQLLFVLVLFFTFIWTIGAALRRRRDARFVFLLWCSLPPLALTGAAAVLKGAPHGNWAGPAYLGLGVALGALWPGRLAVTTMAINAALTIVAALLPLVPWLPPVPGSAEALYGWPEAAQRVEALAARLPAPVAVGTDRYQAAAQITYYTRRRIPVTIFPAPPAGSVWPRPSEMTAASLVWATDAQWGPITTPEQWMADPTEQDSVRFVFRGREVRRFRLWTGTPRRP